MAVGGEEGGDKHVGRANGRQMDDKTDEWTDRRFKKIKGVKLEYKQTERQVDFFSDYTKMFVG